MDSDNKIKLEHSTIEKLLLAYLKEQKNARRWKIFFRIIWFVLFLYIVGWTFNGKEVGNSKITEEHIALINIDGAISEGEQANNENINQALVKAFKNNKVKAVVLSINSPGGSPVQADLINAKIQQLKQEYRKPIYAVARDMCTSAAYYIAVAADKIYANPSSIVGSIGVIMNGFGFNEAMKKIGIDRRVYTAGEHKAMLDPFSPKNEEEEKYIKAMLVDVHQQFINIVKNGRSNKIVLSDEEAFSGLFWSGKQAKDNGIVDELGGLDDIKLLFDNKYKVYDYSISNNLNVFLKKIGVETRASIYNALFNNQLALN